MAKIFVSYRRSDSQDVAGRIVDRLADRFSHGDVFKDVDSIPIGVPFPELLRNALSRTDVALVVIGPTWATVLDNSGNRRLNNPLDFVRIEVETALGSAALVVPVFVTNAIMPDPRELPESLKPLTVLNGISVRPDPDFHRDMDRLISKLEERLGLEAQSDEKSVSNRRETLLSRFLEEVSTYRMPTVTDSIYAAKIVADPHGLTEIAREMYQEIASIYERLLPIFDASKHLILDDWTRHSLQGIVDRISHRVREQLASATRPNTLHIFPPDHTTAALRVAFQRCLRQAITYEIRGPKGSAVSDESAREFVNFIHELGTAARDGKQDLETATDDASDAEPNAAPDRGDMTAFPDV